MQFISKLTNDEESVGHELVSCTSEVTAVRLNSSPGSANIVMVDTPGFDDTHKTDVEILELISEWLNKT